MTFENETTSGVLDPRPERVHDDNYVLNELKRLFIPEISTKNSFDTTLSASETVTGEWEDVSNHASIEIGGNTTADSATDGVKAQFSEDGETIHRNIKTTVSATGETGTFFAFAAEFQYFRLEIENGADSNDIVVETRYNGTAVQSPLRPIGSAPKQTDLAAVSKATIAAQKSDGSIVNLQATSNDHLQSAVSEHEVNTPIKAAGSFAVNQTNVDSTSTVQIATSAPSNRVSVSVKALSGNDASVYIGSNSSVGTNSGYELAAGEAVVLEVDENQDIYAIADSDGQRVSWMHVSE